MKITDYGKRAVCFPEEKRTRKGVRGKLVGGAGCWLGDIADPWDVLSHTSPAPLLHSACDLLGWMGWMYLRPRLRIFMCVGCTADGDGGSF